MHGVFAYNMIAHEFVRALGGGSASSLREMSARFAGPVKPGDVVLVDLWKMEESKDGWGDFRWTARVQATGRACLTDGRAEVKAPTQTLSKI